MLNCKNPIIVYPFVLDKGESGVELSWVDDVLARFQHESISPFFSSIDLNRQNCQTILNAKYFSIKDINDISAIVVESVNNDLVLCDSARFCFMRASV